ncbi:MAG TPA: amidohydrolase family protein [Deltaproteobacteria bacterium]|nr:amidohydrolase family protein [Deltaproteobacteria bacterium]
MEQHSSYIGFSKPPEIDELIDALIDDPPDIRWRVVRTLLRIEDQAKLTEIRHRLRERADRVWESLDWKVKSRLQMAMNSIQKPVRVRGYAVVKGKGAFTIEELETAGYNVEKLDTVIPDPDFYPMVEFHVHPKMPDLKFLSDLRKAEISHAVLLATDTDPADVDRPEIIEKLRMNYALSEQSRKTPFEKYLEFIRSGLYSNTHVTDQDVADWVADYPEILIGFGSVNLSKSREYVEKKLAIIENLGLKGIKLLPYSQFFNPAENENMEVLFEYCRRTGSTILSHSGCAAGPFELVELSQDSRPELWEPMVKKYPDVPVVLAHFASYSSHYPGIWFHEALELMKKYRNVYADISAATYLFDDKENIKKIRNNSCFDQVLFATDYPGPLYYGLSLESIVKQIKANPFLADEEKYAIFSGNANRLLGLN